MSNTMCTSFKKELFGAEHNFKASGGHVFKLALFGTGVTLDDTTTAYATTGEVSSTGYTAGGFAMTNVDPSTSGMAAMVTFGANPNWIGVTFSPSQALLYNTSVSNKAVAVFDFGGVQAVVAGSFTLNLPAVTSTTAMLRLT